jgi:uncharacterized phage-associated protein
LRYSVRSIANAFIALAERDGLALDGTRLQLLVYVAHGVSLGQGRGLVREPVRAWPQGAVFTELFEAFLDLGTQPIPAGRRAVMFDPEAADYRPAPVPADADVCALISETWDRFAKADRHKLAYAVFACAQAPWQIASRALATLDADLRIIPENAISAQFAPHANAALTSPLH